MITIFLTVNNTAKEHIRDKKCIYFKQFILVQKTKNI